MAFPWDRGAVPMPLQWQGTTFFTTTADARTQIAICWQVAADLPQVDPTLIGNEHRLRLMESLRRLLDALAYLDVAVLEPPANDGDETQGHRYRHRYADAYAQLQRAALATNDLFAAVSEGPLVRPNMHVLRQAMVRLRRHLDDLGRVITGPDAKIA